MKILRNGFTSTKKWRRDSVSKKIQKKLFSGAIEGIVIVKSAAVFLHIAKKIKREK